MKRKLLIGIIAVTVFAFALPIFAQTGIPAGSMSQCDTQMQTFLTNYQIPGATFAITKNGKLIYMRAFGTANQTGTEMTQPYHMFRIASISKPITSIAIMKLIENGQLSLSDKPFGPGGILNVDPYFANANITDSRVYNITIQHLLEHSAGWNRDLPMSPSPLSPYPWGYPHSDPIAFPLHVTQTLGEANPVTRRAMIKFSIQKGLNFTPGTVFSYSNIGYLVLGEVIEKKTGMTYENYVKQNILAPLGIYDIRLGKNLLADKQEREGEYINTFTTLSAYGTGQFVPWQYGGWSLEAMDAHGGWIATSRDLVKLLTAVDAFPSRPDILSASTIQTMTTPSATNFNYAKGWVVNSSGTWWHGGSLDGSYSEMVRTNGQVTWAVIFNKRTNASGFGNAVHNLGWNCVNSTTTFPTHDLFDLPTQNASAMNFSNITSNSMTVNWTNGNGDGRVLIMRAGGAPNKFPLDGTEYEASPQVDLGDGNYVVYSGTGNNTTVSNLNSNTNYQFRLYEYKKSVNTGNYALYHLANPASGSQNTLGTTSQTTPRFDFDGDGKTDISIYRPSVGEWWYQKSSNGGNGAFQFGSATDKIVPADFTGDGKTDIAVWRPQTGEWLIMRSEDNSFYSFPFGANGDIPVPADFDADGRADAAVFRPSNSTWYILRSTEGVNIQIFGQAGDVPVAVDYDGDNRTDIAIYRPSVGEWWLQRSGLGAIAFQFGNSTDKPVQGDYTGDGKADVAFFRPSTNEWFVLRSENQSFYSFPFGANGDIATPGDYDGDGKTDAAVFRPSSNVWFVQRSTSGTLIQSFGQMGDMPIPSAFVP
ncbi:MAG TPA: serine hydrolase [Pyrinomonadaceae bacterium]|nr:serine hydrolase [Pyrinomonadaceae bacterium]